MITTPTSHLKHWIDDKGNLTVNPSELKTIFDQAESLCESLLGTTLHVRGKKFVIRMLEIYYGSAGDVSHDWYRTRFVYKKSKYVGQTEIQSHKGPKIYLSSMDTNDSYTRMDIVVGDENVAISFLLRSVWDDNFERIGQHKGSPNIVLNKMGILPSDHGAEISFGTDAPGDIHWEDTREQIFREKKLNVYRSRRINITSGYEEENNLQWNFYAD